ncbi:hypothetical protein SNE40_020414 [Patella caerulea]|uniref:Novel STAND NTPase 3 domain-containing protein n=1 Tax=Patella caerulea TaxID=87958 RepID=A0AAN8GE13_PATCE
MSNCPSEGRIRDSTARVHGNCSNLQAGTNNIVVVGAQSKQLEQIEGSQTLNISESETTKLKEVIKDDNNRSKTLNIDENETTKLKEVDSNNQVVCIVGGKRDNSSATDRPQESTVDIHGNVNYLHVGPNNKIIAISPQSEQEQHSDIDSGDEDITEGDTNGDSSDSLVTDRSELGCIEIPADQKDKFHFCYEVDKTFISIGSCCSIIPIAINKEIFDKINSKEFKIIVDNTNLVSISWPADEGDAETTVHTNWKIEFLNQQDEDVQLEAIFNIIQGEQFEKLRQLILKLIEGFRAKLRHINTGCIMLIVSHDNRELAQKMLDNQDLVEQILKETIIPKNAAIKCTCNIVEHRGNGIQMPPSTPNKPNKAHLWAHRTSHIEKDNITHERGLARGKTHPVQGTKSRAPSMSHQLSLPIGFEEHLTGSFAEAIANGQNILQMNSALLICGKPGCGKTYFAELMTKHLMTSNPDYQLINVKSPEQLRKACTELAGNLCLIDIPHSNCELLMLLEYVLIIEECLTTHSHIKCILTSTEIPPDEFSTFKLFRQGTVINLNKLKYSQWEFENMCKRGGGNVSLISELYMSEHFKSLCAGSLGLPLIIQLMENHLEKRFEIKDLQNLLDELIEKCEKEEPEKFISLVALFLVGGSLSRENTPILEEAVEFLNSVYASEQTVKDVVETLSGHSSDSWSFYSHDKTTDVFRFKHAIYGKACFQRFSQRNMEALIKNCSSNILLHLSPSNCWSEETFASVVDIDHYDLLITRFQSLPIDQINFLFFLDHIFLGKFMESLQMSKMTELFSAQPTLVGFQDSQQSTYTGTFWRYIFLFGSTEACKICVEIIHRCQMKSMVFVDAEGRTPLHFAVESPICGKDKVKLLMDDKIINIYFDIDQLDALGNTALHIAVLLDRVEVAETLLANGSNPRLTNNDGLSAFDLAVERELIDILEYLLKYSTDNQAYLNELLIMAVKNHHSTVVKLLLDNGADANQITSDVLHDLRRQNDEELLSMLHAAASHHRLTPGLSQSQSVLMPQSTLLERPTFRSQQSVYQSYQIEELPLHNAVKTSFNEAELRQMLQNGESADTRDISGDSALHIAVQYHNIIAVQMFTEYGANVDAENPNGDRPLHMACSSNQLAVTRVLLGKGATVDCVNKDQNTPLHIAVRYSDIQLVHLLISQSSAINRANIEGDTPIHVAAKYGRINIINYLVTVKGLNIAALNKRNETPLHAAIISEKDDTAMTLINKMENLDIRDDDGSTFVHLAVVYCSSKVLESLLERGADTNSINQLGETPLHIAAKTNNAEAAKVLIEKGCNVNSKCPDGNTPLHIAAKTNNAEAAKVLIEKGCNVNSKCPDGNTPLHFAAKNGSLEVVNILLRHHGVESEASNKDRYTALYYASRQEIRTALVNSGCNKTRTSRCSIM